MYVEKAHICRVRCSVHQLNLSTIYQMFSLQSVWRKKAVKLAVADRGVSGPWGPQFCGALCKGVTQRLLAGGSGAM